MKSLKERLWEVVEVLGPDECWPFTGYCDKDGYGIINSGEYTEAGWPKVMRAHRAAWITKRGPIPKGLNVLHTCDWPPCCNDNHHFLGTTAENNFDRWLKGGYKRYAYNVKLTLEAA